MMQTPLWQKDLRAQLLVALPKRADLMPPAKNSALAPIEHF